MEEEGGEVNKTVNRSNANVDYKIIVSQTRHTITDYPNHSIRQGE